MQNRTLNLLETISVLIVEDDELARTVIKQGLKPYCKSFYSAKDGLEGLELFKKYPIDIIVTDIHMPNLNGFEMIKEILKLKPRQLFLVMTSYDNDKNIVNSIQEGACSFLRKPLDIEDLQTALLLNSGNIKYKKLQLTDEVLIDYQEEIIYKDGEAIYLSHKNNKIFWILSYNVNKLVSYELFEDFVYDGEVINHGALHNAILRIKKQFKSLNIENIANSGYILRS